MIVITLKRPEVLRRCLKCLRGQVPAPDQIIVVDASPDDLSRRVCEEEMADFPDFLYLRNENGFGRMTHSRNIGLRHAKGGVIAFLDDDAFAHPGWAQNLLDTYIQNPVQDGESKPLGAVGGRALNGQPNEEHEGKELIGKLLSDGRLMGFFAADPGRIIEVDHIMGCNMSFRRETLAKLGGFREDYPGISGVREDSDMCLRVQRAGYRLLFNPQAVVDHIGAPQAIGRRFDQRYEFYSQRNHLVLLLSNKDAGVFFRYLAGSLVRATITCARQMAGALVRWGAVMLGTVMGLYSAAVALQRRGRKPERTDDQAEELRRILSEK